MRVAAARETAVRSRAATGRALTHLRSAGRAPPISRELLSSFRRLWLRHMGPRSGRRGPEPGVLLHLLLQTQRPHVRPDFLDVCQTLGLRPALSGIVPAERIRLVGAPD